MKRRFASFLSGFLACALIVGVSVSALAISGRMTIEVDPISIQVNGYPFAPIDAKGNDVPIFAYNGTTYAPLRALAEAYGLEVGYDATTNMATVIDPDAKQAQNPAAIADYSDWSPEAEAAYQEFKAMWDIKFLRYAKESNGIEHAFFDAICVDPNYSGNDLEAMYKSTKIFFDRLGFELLEKENTPWVNIFFKTDDGGWLQHYVHN